MARLPWIRVPWRKRHPTATKDDAEEQPGAVPADRGLAERVDAEALWTASPPGQPKRQRLLAWSRFLLLGQRPEPIATYRGPVEDPRPGSIGICCSGGGVRSAAFNLGALQALQRARELQEADYLAAVSGGSYIAAAFSMVGTRWQGEERPPRDTENPDNGHDDSNPRLLERTRVFAPGSPEEQYLRNRSSYLAPDGTGKLYLAFRLLLGLVFNLAFLALPIIALTILAGLLIYGPTLEGLSAGCESNCGLDLPLAWKLAPAPFFALGLLIGLFWFLRRPRRDDVRRFSEIWSTRLLVLSAFVALVAIALPELVDLVRPEDPPEIGAESSRLGGAGGLGIAGLLAGLVAYLRGALATPKKAAAEISATRQKLAGLSSRIRWLLVSAAGAIAGPLVLLTMAVWALAFTFQHYEDDRLWLTVGAVGAFGLWALMYSLADLTSWSLHPFYKRRLCSAFALKRVLPADEGMGRTRVGDQDEEGIAVERDYDRLVPLSQTALDKRPTLVVCAAANVSDPGATPPGRRVTSFTFSANTIGGPLIGGVKTKDFVKAFGGRRRRDFTLPTAVAMSGAALSPTMGKLTKRSFTFLMTLANIRLGVWVPNPRWVAGTSAAQRRLFGRPRPWYLLRELLGRNRVDAKYLYVTDGGHYENLGLVELLRRGCTQIYCFDASGGRTFGDLGDAVALARSELGVHVQIDPTPLIPDGDPPTARAAVVAGKFTYRSGEEGILVYARNIVGPGVPWDVRALQRRDPRFPHHSTMDQLYTDQKFESYRALGQGIGDEALALMTKEVEAEPARSASS